MKRPKFEIDIDPGDFEQEVVETAMQAYYRALELTTMDAVGNIRRESPVDQGRLAGSFVPEKEDPLIWHIRSGVEYALWVHDGTGVYGPQGQPITPVSANALVFEGEDGSLVVTRSVLGQEPNPYADRALTVTADRVNEFIRRALREVSGA